MRKISSVIIAALILSGCATKMAYMNTKKTADEVNKDKAQCQAAVDASDYRDADLKRNKFNQCMNEKGYEVVSQDKAQKVQGFTGLWISPGAPLKAYDAVFIGKVDVSKAQLTNTGIPNTKTTDEDINNLGEEMRKRFSNAVSVVMPVIADKTQAEGKRILCIGLKLNNIAQTNIGVNTALKVAGHFTPVPLPGGPEGKFSFEGEVSDYNTKDKLITVSDECKESKNASLAGLEKFEKWKSAYNVMDYWADHMAALLAKQRGQGYKSRLGIKLVDF